MKYAKFPRNEYYKHCSITCGLITLITLTIWIIFTVINPFFYCCTKSTYSLFALLSSHFTFLIIFLIGAFITYKLYCKQTEAYLKENEFLKKIEWELFQNSIRNTAEENKRIKELEGKLEIEKTMFQKFKNDHAEFSLDREKQFQTLLMFAFAENKENINPDKLKQTIANALKGYENIKQVYNELKNIDL